MNYYIYIYCNTNIIKDPAIDFGSINWHLENMPKSLQDLVKNITEK